MACTTYSYKEKYRAIRKGKERKGEERKGKRRMKMSSMWTLNEIIERNGLRDAVTLQRSIHDVLNVLHSSMLPDELKKQIEEKLDDAYWILVDHTNARLSERIETSSN